ncbi:FAD/NAD(P)-dependent oxidoreductase [Burkholderia sp. WSM2232]|uniref:FAD/NAD(P)-dependent oxidoreductase n=1 Tax=Burkholderia sp. WSM2232 TaxID=944436 RepID=UPI000557CD29|nr:FAD/NAD(P)-binding oxidoreductase [Burkholderia sp. WSM2232]
MSQGKRVVVVGAGPAGVRAAAALVSAGLRPVVIDEGSHSGGQIYRRQPIGFTRPAATLYGAEADKAVAVHRTFDTLEGRVDYRPDTLAWNVYDGVLHTMKGQQAQSVEFDAIIIAVGATDRLLPLEGWTLPGVYTLGASQIALKAQACAIGSRVVFMGTGPLLYLVAYQYMKAGANVAAVLDTSPMSLRIKALPELLSRPGTLFKGMRYVSALRRAGVRMEAGITPLKVEGNETVAGVSVELANGQREEIACDALGMGYHVRSEVQLADLARCNFVFDETTRQWLPEVDKEGRTSVKGVYVAGDGARTLGADAAEIGGELAALAVLKDLGMDVSKSRVAELQRAQRTQRRFATGIAHAFPFPVRQLERLPDHALLCRCESITAGELRRSVMDLGAPEVNRAKALTRVGMGRCQGRYCGLASAEVVSATLGVPVKMAGRLRAQAPIKPLPIAAESTQENV